MFVICTRQLPFMFWKGSSRLVEVLKAWFESWKDSSQLVEVQQQLFWVFGRLVRASRSLSTAVHVPWRLVKADRRAPRFSVSIPSKASPALWHPGHSEQAGSFLLSLPVPWHWLCWNCKEWWALIRLWCIFCHSSTHVCAHRGIYNIPYMCFTLTGSRWRIHV